MKAYLAGNFVAEQPTSTSGADGPGVDILRITPYEIAEGSLVRDLLGSCHDSDLVKSSNLRRETTVYTEDFAINNGGKG